MFHLFIFINLLGATEVVTIEKYIDAMNNVSIGSISSYLMLSTGCQCVEIKISINLRF